MRLVESDLLWFSAFLCMSPQIRNLSEVFSEDPRGSPLQRGAERRRFEKGAQPGKSKRGLSKRGLSRDLAKKAPMRPFRGNFCASPGAVVPVAGNESLDPFVDDVLRIFPL